MLEKNNLIVIYGKAGSYKSSLGVSLLNNYDNSCYINLEKNSHIKINDSIKVFNEIDSIDFIKKCINDYSVILVDYLELLEINKEGSTFRKDLFVAHSHYIVPKSSFKKAPSTQLIADTIFPLSSLSFQENKFIRAGVE